MDRAFRRSIGLGCLVALLAGGVAATPAAAGQTGKRRDFVIEPEHLACILEWDRVRNFRITNLVSERKRKRALRVAKRERGRYPVGTVIQLIPFEVMVKRGRGFSKETRDWEFLTLAGFRQFRLQLDPATGNPIIDTRGTTEVVNFLDGNCFACHGKSKKRFDLVCEQEHGCDPLPLSGLTPEGFDDIARTGDPRCAALP